VDNLGIVLNSLTARGGRAGLGRAEAMSRGLWPKLLIATICRGAGAGARRSPLRRGDPVETGHSDGGHRAARDRLGAQQGRSPISSGRGARSAPRRLIWCSETFRRRGDRQSAIRAYRDALTFAPVESPTIARVRERLEALGAGP
jgi:hypothetical protein